LLLVHVHCHKLEADRRHLLQMHEHVEHGVTVLAAGQTDHDPVSVLDHVVIGDGFGGQSTQTFLKLVLIDTEAGHGENPGCAKRRILPVITAQKNMHWSSRAVPGARRVGSTHVDGADAQPPEDHCGCHHSDQYHQSHRQYRAGEQEAFFSGDVHENGNTLIEQVG